jgi:hypothetical protein
MTDRPEVPRDDAPPARWMTWAEFCRQAHKTPLPLAAVLRDLAIYEPLMRALDAIEEEAATKPRKRRRSARRR